MDLSEELRASGQARTLVRCHEMLRYTLLGIYKRRESIS